MESFRLSKKTNETKIE